MVSTANPYCTVIFQFFPTQREPFQIKGIDIFLRPTFIPIAFINAYHLTALHADATTRQKIRRVSKYHVELEIELWQQLKRVATNQVEIVIGGMVKGTNCFALSHAYRASIDLINVLFFAHSSSIMSATLPKGLL